MQFLKKIGITLSFCNNSSSFRIPVKPANAQFVIGEVIKLTVTKGY